MVVSCGGVTWLSHVVELHCGVAWWFHVVETHGGVTWLSHMVESRGRVTWLYTHTHTQTNKYIWSFNAQV
jgi:hypothetical protein